ncbi:redoxin domain-containing protein, partial [bacterium]|nr:redoxin domain-containing protein [bacterium]
MIQRKKYFGLRGEKTQVFLGFETSITGLFLITHFFIFSLANLLFADSEIKHPIHHTPFLSPNYLFGQISSETVFPPKILGITPNSFSAEMTPPLSANFSTHYQLSLNGALFGASTKNSTILVNHMTPGMTYSVQGIVYQNGEVFGVSSPAQVLLTPPTPSNLSASNISTSSFLLLWKPVSTAIQYKVYRDGKTLLATTLASESSILLTGFQAGELVSVNVVAKNNSGDSFLSNPLIVQLKPKPPVITIVASQIKQTSFALSWSSVESAASYTVFKDDVSFKTVGATVTSLIVDGCEPGATITAYVTAINQSGSSEPSSKTQVLTIPATPPKPWTTSIGTNSFVLGWSTIKGASAYKVYRDVDWQIGYILAPATGSKFSIGFNPGTTASITVVSSNRSGDSFHSPPLSVTFLTNATATFNFHQFSCSANKNSFRFGEKIPDFSLNDVENRLWNLKELANSHPVVFFFFDPNFTANSAKDIQNISELLSLTEISGITFVQISRGVKNPKVITKSQGESKLPIIFLVDKN